MIVNEELSLRRAGFFYVMLACPDLSVNRVKMGFASNVEKRKRAFMTICPTVKLIKFWPCCQDNETAIINHVANSSCKVVGREVFDFDSVDALVKTLDDIFSSGNIPELCATLNVSIPRRIADELRLIGETQDRSMSYIVKKACEAYRDANRKPRPE
jgi:hypothetical protein